MSFKYKLPKDYHIRELSSEEFNPLFRKYAKLIFVDKSLMYDYADVISKKENNSFKNLREKFKSKSHLFINLGLFYKNKFVGWAFGYQETPLTFYMCNSAILNPHRRKGLYTCLMREMLNRAIEKGFDKIYSRHVITNNDIIIAKLKQNFKITTFELSEPYGTLVHLTYYPSKIKNEILDFRAGHKRPSKRIKKIFKM